MVDQVFTFKETLIWRVRVEYNEQRYDGIALAKEALLLLSEDSAAIEPGDESGLKWVLTEPPDHFHPAPEIALTAEEIIGASGREEKAFYRLG